MKFEQLFVKKTNILTNDGKKVSCNYLNNSRFSFDCKLSLSLHYVFCAYGRERSYSRAYTLRAAINHFLNFIEIYESHSVNINPVDQYIKITSELVLNFNRYCLKNKLMKGLASRFNGALKSTAMDNDDGLPLLTLPLIEIIKGEPNEALSDSGFDSLSDALKKHCELINNKIIFNQSIRDVDSYTLEEIILELDTNSRHPLENISKWKPCLIKCHKTLLAAKLPFNVSMDDFFNIYDTAVNKKPIELSNPVEIIIKYFDLNSVDLTFNDFLELSYPSSQDQAVLAVFLMLQLGWNKEIVMALDGDNFEFSLVGLFDSKNSIIFSEKIKSQSINKPYLEPKPFFGISNKSDPISAYNLILLAKTFSEPFSILPEESTRSYTQKHNNLLFSCMRKFGTWRSKKKNCKLPPGRFSSMSNSDLWTTGIEAFLRNYIVLDDGNRIRTLKQLTCRLRPTWVKKSQEIKSLPLSFVSFLQGHASKTTTDVHYDNSAQAKVKRRKRLRSELSEILKLFQQKKFKGLLGKVNNNKNTSKKWVSFIIPGHDLPMWSCIDNTKPDWEGSVEYMSSRKKCFKLSKCLFCSRICVTKDSLPFLLDRQNTLIESIDPLDADKNEELSIVNFLVSDWKNKTELQSASRYQNKFGKKILPFDLDILSVIFEG
ncbi:hypothetical protein [Pseudoalteromonas denitrificans]|uniref:Uncharacterized protein n=1 Tax=Pseudoalteromonas denitrificans DSM 6059 TaxID=1123010 RepID=A0A1I1Q6M5_9GAMM|nr:hypothetical protein [Pseudoalteromonas denitrificans]SFD17622.1 hypothetical protein SAMN02745724_03767 [Pseudoalteromonas denitrificans DSM 6059]